MKSINFLGNTALRRVIPTRQPCCSFDAGTSVAEQDKPASTLLEIARKVQLAIPLSLNEMRHLVEAAYHAYALSTWQSLPRKSLLIAVLQAIKEILQVITLSEDDVGFYSIRLNCEGDAIRRTIDEKMANLRSPNHPEALCISQCAGFTYLLLTLMNGKAGDLDLEQLNALLHDSLPSLLLLAKYDSCQQQALGVYQESEKPSLQGSISLKQKWRDTPSLLFTQGRFSLRIDACLTFNCLLCWDNEKHSLSFGFQGFDQFLRCFMERKQVSSDEGYPKVYQFSNLYLSDYGDNRELRMGYNSYRISITKADDKALTRLFCEIEKTYRTEICNLQEQWGAL